MKRIRNKAAQPPSATLPATQQLLAASRAELGRVIAGQNEVIGEVLVAVLTQGHALLEGVPGIAKTLIVKSVGRLLGLGFQRVQGTPDLMPADILGTTIFRPGTDTFTFHAGPVFTDLLLVDEINRMPPRTQAALLECMEERQVTSDGVQRPLPPWFTVFATENPIDFEGTYPLPEAQLDRFLLKIKVSYPAPDEERQMLERHHGSGSANLLEDAKIQPLSAQLLAAARDEIRAIRVESDLYGYILDLVRRTREWPMLALGASPRAAICLLRVAQAFAAFEDRDYVIPDDVKRAASAGAAPSHPAQARGRARGIRRRSRAQRCSSPRLRCREGDFFVPPSRADSRRLRPARPLRVWPHAAHHLAARRGPVCSRCRDFFGLPGDTACWSGMRWCCSRPSLTGCVCRLRNKSQSSAPGAMRPRSIAKPKSNSASTTAPRRFLSAIWLTTCLTH